MPIAVIIVIIIIIIIIMVRVRRSAPARKFRASLEEDGQSKEVLRIHG